MDYYTSDFFIDADGRRHSMGVVSGTPFGIHAIHNEWLVLEKIDGVWQWYDGDFFLSGNTYVFNDDCTEEEVDEVTKLVVQTAHAIVAARTVAEYTQLPAGDNGESV